MKRIFCLFLFSSILFGCSKDSDELISIKGITERDEGGNLIGNQDITDWTSDNEFPSKVGDFLTYIPRIDYSTAQVATLNILAYPNPFENSFYFSLNCSKATVCRFVIVDESLKVYFAHELLLNSGSNEISLEASNFPKNKNLRIYYIFYDSSAVLYDKGHGDIRRI